MNSDDVLDVYEDWFARYKALQGNTMARLNAACWAGEVLAHQLADEVRELRAKVDEQNAEIVRHYEAGYFE